MSNSSKSVMAGANDVWWSACYDDRYEVMDATIARIQANATTTKLIAPDGISIAKVEDTNFEFNDGTGVRILADVGSSRMLSQDGGTYMSVSDGGIYLNHNGQPRLNLTSTDSYLFSPDSTKWIQITNSGITLQGDTEINGLNTLIGDGVNFRMEAKTVGLKSVIGWYKSDGTRIGWIGHGTSANYNLTIRNEGVGGNLMLYANDGTIILSNLPTSSAGLPAGGLYKSGGFVKIV